MVFSLYFFLKAVISTVWFGLRGSPPRNSLSFGRRLWTVSLVWCFSYPSIFRCSSISNNKFATSVRSNISNPASVLPKLKSQVRQKTPAQFVGELALKKTSNFFDMGCISRRPSGRCARRIDCTCCRIWLLGSRSTPWICGRQTFGARLNYLRVTCA